VTASVVRFQHFPTTMKYCSQCGGSYPNDFQTCPKDQNVLHIASELAPGMVIRNKWIILDKIGAGGMATVYRVRHQAFGTSRAIKVIDSRLAEDAVFVKRFHAEAVLAQKLQHPNVIRIEDLDSTEDGRPFIVMEYVEGHDLRRLIAHQGTLSIARALKITGQVASALAAAHKIGIIHRDIKPDNILISTSTDGGDLVKVTDFGIAKARKGSDAGTFTFGTENGVLVGTPAYMSPEQVEGVAVDARSDLYSLCIVLYEMLTGKLPFHSDTPLGMALRRLNSEPVPLRDAKPELEIPQLLSDVLTKALERDREKRFQTVSDFMAALHGFAAESAQAEAETVIASPPLPRTIVQISEARSAAAGVGSAEARTIAASAAIGPAEALTIAADTSSGTAKEYNHAEASPQLAPFRRWRFWAAVAVWPLAILMVRPFWWLWMRVMPWNPTIYIYFPLNPTGVSFANDLFEWRSLSVPLLAAFYFVAGFIISLTLFRTRRMWIHWTCITFGSIALGSLAIIGLGLQMPREAASPYAPWFGYLSQNVLFALSCGMASGLLARWDRNCRGTRG
jgi:serine/threonine protein kinase